MWWSGAVLGDLNEGNEPWHPLGNVLPRQEDSSGRIPEEGGAEHSRSSRNPCARNWESRAGVGDRWGLAGGSLGQYPQCGREALALGRGALHSPSGC